LTFIQLFILVLSDQTAHMQKKTENALLTLYFPPVSFLVSRLLWRCSAPMCLM